MGYYEITYVAAPREEERTVAVHAPDEDAAKSHILERREFRCLVSTKIITAEQAEEFAKCGQLYGA